MAAIRKPGKVNNDSALIDYGVSGIGGGGAVYSIQAERTCLIDGGSRKGANRIIKAFESTQTFPDIVIITHSHWDHCQAIPALRKRAVKLGRKIEVMASEKAIPLLEDQSWSKPGCRNITDVIPLKEGDTVDLGRITLRIFDTPGHCKDHIAILDEVNKNIFVGDAIGAKFGDNMFIPPFFLPFWDRDAYYATIDKLKRIDYETLCLAHYGCIYGDEAKAILDESVATYEKWWQLFTRSTEKLDDTEYMLQVILEEMKLVPKNHEILSPNLKLLFGLVTGWSKLMGRKPQSIGQFLFRGLLQSLIVAYKTYEKLL